MKRRVIRRFSIMTTSSNPPPPPPMNRFFDTWLNVDQSTPEQQTKRNNLKWFTDKLGYANTESTIRESSGELYQNCVNASAHDAFYHIVQLQPDFRTQSGILLLHVWMLQRRLMTIPKEGKIMQESLFDRLWDDIMLRLRHAGIPEMSINKYLLQVQQQSFTACVAYDGSVADLAKGKKTKELKKSLLDNIHLHLLQKEGDPLASERMMTYVLGNVKRLEKTSDDVILKGSIGLFTPPPKVVNLNTTKLMTWDVEIIGKEYEKVWRSTLDQKGRVYYWNKNTRISTWKLPEESEVV